MNNKILIHCLHLVGFFFYELKIEVIFPTHFSGFCCCILPPAPLKKKWWGESPETCWASYKYGIIKFWYIVCILLDFSLWIENCSNFPFTFQRILLLYIAPRPPQKKSGEGKVWHCLSDVNVMVDVSIVGCSTGLLPQLNELQYNWHYLYGYFLFV